MLQGVNAITQKCQPNVTPNFLQGVSRTARKRHSKCAPASFIWCQLRIAAMPFEQRTKGRVIRDQQICHSMDALPNQFNGDTDMTQQCLNHNSPRERSWKVRKNAAIVPPLPTSLTGAITTSQKCYKVNAPREGSSKVRRDAAKGAPFPTSFKGPTIQRRNANHGPPPPNLGHQTPAEMPRM